MTRSVVRRRSTHRLVHLLLAVGLGVFVYSPLRTVPEAVVVVQVALFPLLALSGVLLWTGPRLWQS